MRILLWHGYLLRGTGSNIYKANLVREWRLAGHDVLLMCQEREVGEFDFIDEHGDFDPDNKSYALQTTGAPPAAGRATIVRPDIGEILPVYVVDHYEGFTAKQYLDLTPAELNEYVRRNVAALVTAIERHKTDVIIAGHEVMGPYIALQAAQATQSSYAAQLHGSALEYVVKHDEQYRQFAIEGLCGAHAVIGGSEYMVREASAIVPGWIDRARVVNPGCDVELFKPATSRDPKPTVGFVGKFMTQKGPHNLLAALGLVRAKELRAVIVGYGELDAELRQLWRFIQSGDRAAIRSIAQANSTMRPLLEFAESVHITEEYFARAATVELEFTGRLEHGPLSHVLPTFDILVVPSVVAEAFGMVAAEAAACGVLPIVPNHSGIGEVGTILEGALGAPGLLTFDSAHPIDGIAEAIDRVLSLPTRTREEMGKVIADLAHERWSWPTVAQSLVEAARR
jgi:glycosyltransferase involved in cell wall biosynthesis